MKFVRALVVAIASLDIHLAIAFAMRAAPPVITAPRTRGAIDIALENAPLEPPKTAAPIVESTSRAKPSPPPPAARAAPVLVAPTPIDFATADAPNFPGGFTHPLGTSSAPVFNPHAQPYGVEGGTGEGGGIMGGQLAHPLERDWRCPWPARGHEASVFETRVHVIVHVARDGSPTSVDTLDELVPGLGFPDAARACAMRQRYRPARDVRGHAVDGRTGRFAVIFYTF